MPSEKKQSQETEENESPLKPGACRCGIPNCRGHQIIDGEVTILNHPVHGNVKFTVPENASSGRGEERKGHGEGNA